MPDTIKEGYGNSEALKRTEELEKAQQERFEKVAEKILKVFSESDIILSEYPAVIKVAGEIMTKRLDNATMSSVLSL